MANNCGWTWINDNAQSPDNPDDLLAAQPVIEKLAAEWNGVQTKIEARCFQFQAMRDEDGEPYFDTDADYEAWRKCELAIYRLLQERLSIIEDHLARYGARMMRPYEHWNEDEQYMEYMEYMERER